MKKLILLTAVVGLMAWTTAITKADDLTDLKQQLAELQKKVEALEAKKAVAPAAGEDSAQKLQKRMDDLELAQAQAAATQERQNLAMSQKMEMSAGTLPSNLKWLDSIKISGDVRERFEQIKLEDDAKPDRNRARFRARIQLDAPVNPEWSLGFRIASDTGSTNSAASGAGDPVSTNQTFGDSFTKKSLFIDLAYIDFHPGAIPNLNIYAGKMNNPFYIVGKNQLIWDSDLTPEGVAATYKYNLGDNDQLFANVGGFYVTEQETAADISLWGVQGGLKHNFDKNTYLLGGASYYIYDNVKGSASLDWSGKGSFFGNSNGGGKFNSNYELDEFFGEYGMNVGDLPVTAYGDYVNNPVAISDDGTGWLVGGKLNKAVKAGSWEVSYDYRRLQKDAVVGAFCDSDFIGGGTDGKGHRIGAAYQITDNVQTALNLFLDKKMVGGDDKNYQRLQADLLIKF